MQFHLVFWVVVQVHYRHDKKGYWYKTFLDTDAERLFVNQTYCVSSRWHKLPAKVWSKLFVSGLNHAYFPEGDSGFRVFQTLECITGIQNCCWVVNVPHGTVVSLYYDICDKTWVVGLKFYEEWLSNMDVQFLSTFSRQPSSTRLLNCCTDHE